MVKALLCVIGAVAILTGQAANAAVVTHGNLTSDSSTNYIVDTVTGRQYTRLDAVNMTYSQVQSAIAAGGAYEGWSIMRSADIDEFLAATQGASSTPCDGSVANGTSCPAISGWTDGDFGNGYESNFDLIAYLGNDLVNAVGVIEIFRTGEIRRFESFRSIPGYDFFVSQSILNLMLYRDNRVPAPATLWLVGLGIALILRRHSAANGTWYAR